MLGGCPALLTIRPLFARLAKDSDPGVQQACAGAIERHFNALGTYVPAEPFSPKLLNDARLKVNALTFGTYPMLKDWLGGQLAKPSRQHRRVLGTKLPGHRHPAELAVRVLHRRARLAYAAQPAQRHHPRRITGLTGQPGADCGEQVLAAGQELRSRRHPHRHPGHLCPVKIHPADRQPAGRSVDRPRPCGPRGPGIG